MMVPLSEKMRPSAFEKVSGQREVILGLDAIVRSGKPLSLLFFGPPGCGKTTIARLYAKSFQLPLVQLSAVLNTTQELKKLLKESGESPLFQRQTIVFVDEIHRFNRAQQDIFLPFLEDGTLILIGSTTENPSFVLNNALLSRLRAWKLEPLGPQDLEQILLRYEESVAPLNLSLNERAQLIAYSQGDARHLLNMVENLEGGLKMEKKLPLYDRHQEGHYNLISALHKAVRGSDPDAALYWLARMLEGGEDPLYLARRCIRMATEDIGLADPHALTIALNAWNVYKMLGSPEGELALAEAVIYLALSPKSNAIYTAYGEARKLAADTGHLDPPKQILNAPTEWMKQFGIGKDYQYDHDLPQGFSGDNYFPANMERPTLYHPVERGFEREMKKRLEYFQKLRLRQSNL
ncbi:MAG: replication-associated recombination protein A [Verrucomicrobia bacterium]|nr:replication-associated recombination protein A [Verrucomicrobiota bacterium]MDE3047836.1 replication-associated recombination protein A [Verrucomicrobiota bacterium]